LKNIDINYNSIKEMYNKHVDSGSASRTYEFIKSNL